MIMIEIEMNNMNECSKQFGTISYSEFSNYSILGKPAGKRSLEFLEISSFCAAEYSCISKVFQLLEFSWNNLAVLAT